MYTSAANILLSLALAPIGFIYFFILDWKKRGCKCSEKVEPVSDDVAEKNTVPGQVVMVDQNPEQTNKLNLNNTEPLGKYKVSLIGLEIPDILIAVATLLYGVGYRAVFVAMQVTKKNFVNPALFAIDVLLAVYFAYKKMYCPGCLYNEVLMVLNNEKFKTVGLINISETSSCLSYSNTDLNFNF
jgi:hypothetical protein